jgi:CheY-like chemotaxis protein
MAQRLPDSDVRPHRNQHPVAGRSPEKQRCVEPEKYGALNQTRGCLLGWNVDVGDFSVASLNDRIPALLASSGGGIWLLPFRGISLINGQTPFDLIYLDANSVVIDVVESFPIFCISNASPPAASVLALPGKTISSTETQRGDQLVLCAAAEFNRRFQQLLSSSNKVETALRTDPGKVQPICIGSGSRLQPDDSAGQELFNKDAPPVGSSPTPQSCGNDRKKKNFEPVKNWWQRWWSPVPPEPRKALRESIPGLGAHFFTGGAPVEHSVRDISLTGLYVITEERWFPGTQVRMTLTDSGESTVQNVITANTTVVRWGNDGVGLKFVIQDEKGLRQGQSPLGNGIAQNELNRFLQLAENGKRRSETLSAASRNDVAQGSATEDTDGQKFSPSIGPEPVLAGPGGDSSLIGVSTGPTLVNVSGLGMDGIEAVPHCEVSSPLSCIPPNLKASPLDRPDAISGNAAPHSGGLFIGPVNSSLLIDGLKDLGLKDLGLKDLPRSVSIAAGSPSKDPSKASRMKMPGVVSSTPSRRQFRILLIDDEELEITFLVDTLKEDYEIISASDGVTALESAGRNMPDLILLDVMMPGIDGFEVCRRLKADSRTKEIPVIFITGLSDAAFETRGLKMGAVDYISKPFHPAPLRARVNMHLKLRMA